MIARPISHPDDRAPTIEVSFEDDDGLLELELSASSSSMAAATPARANVASGAPAVSEDPSIEDLDAGFDALLGETHDKTAGTS